MQIAKKEGERTIFLSLLLAARSISKAVISQFQAVSSSIRISAQLFD
jgi:hypothetical protein